MIVIASDHAGFDFNRESCHYPVFAEKAARGIADGTWEKGILVCGTGLGMSMAANKIPGIRCALLSDCFSAEMARAHNDANMMALGGRVIGPELAKRIVDTFLNTGFMGGKHELRVNMIRDLEKK